MSLLNKSGNELTAVKLEEAIFFTFFFSVTSLGSTFCSELLKIYIALQSLRIRICRFSAICFTIQLSQNLFKLWKRQSTLFIKIIASVQIKIQLQQLKL